MRLLRVWTLKRECYIQISAASLLAMDLEETTESSCVRVYADLIWN